MIYEQMFTCVLLYYTINTKQIGYYVNLCIQNTYEKNSISLKK